MSLVLRTDYIEGKCEELSFLVRVLRKTYNHDDKALHQSIRKCMVLNDVKKLEEHPEEVLDVILPLILSYKADEREFEEVVDSLVNKGVMEFYSELDSVKKRNRAW